MNDDAAQQPDPAGMRTVVFGFFLLAVFVPMGLTLEALHAWKVDVYLGSELRHEMWKAAHAHGGLLGILCLAYGGCAPRWLPAAQVESVGRLLRWGAVLMPVGFFTAGILNAEGDPSLGILLVPAGGLLLLLALLRAALACCKVQRT